MAHAVNSDILTSCSSGLTKMSAYLYQRGLDRVKHGKTTTKAPPTISTSMLDDDVTSACTNVSGCGGIMLMDTDEASRTTTRART